MAQLVNLEEYIKMEIQNILLEETVKVDINPMFDIPEYTSNKVSKAHNKKILVMGGGGVKGLSYFGALQAFQELDMLHKFEEFSCNSIATLVIGMYLIGYSVSELWKFSTNFNFGKVKNINILDFVSKFGLDDGSKVEYMIKRLIQGKGHNEDISLRDVFLITNKLFVVSTVCVNSKSVKYVSHETDPDLPLWKAIRMSSSIPWFYTPVKYNSMLYVDGGCIDNYPCYPYRHRLDEVVGLQFKKDRQNIEDINDLETYMLRVIMCLNSGLNYTLSHCYEQCTIKINLDAVSIIDYNVSDDQKSKMFNAGYNAVMKRFSS